MLYRVTLNTPDQYQPCWNAEKTAIVGSLKAARLLAAEWLAPHTRWESDYSARVKRAADCTVQEIGNSEGGPLGGHRETIEATTHIVPSCGDVGYY